MERCYIINKLNKVVGLSVCFSSFPLDYENPLLPLQPKSAPYMLHVPTFSYYLILWLGTYLFPL